MDENLREVHHDWPVTDDGLSYGNVHCDGFVTLCAPSTLINRECEFQFAYLCSEGTSINQVFAQHMCLFTNGNTSVEFVTGLEKWIVPIVTRSATTSDGERRNSLATEEGDYVEASERYSCALEIRLENALRRWFYH